MVHAPATREVFYKIKLCPHNAAGTCTKGDNCFYAHSPEDLRSMPNLSKTRLCDKWIQGVCGAEHCPFAHGERELRSTIDYFKTDLCKYWKVGKCNAGKSCRHAHGAEELKPRKHSASDRPLSAASTGAVRGQFNPTVCRIPPAPPAPPPPAPPCTPKGATTTATKMTGGRRLQQINQQVGGPVRIERQRSRGNGRGGGRSGKGRRRNNQQLPSVNVPCPHFVPPATTTIPELKTETVGGGFPVSSLPLLESTPPGSRPGSPCDVSGVVELGELVGDGDADKEGIRSVSTTTPEPRDFLMDDAKRRISTSTGPSTPPSISCRDGPAQCGSPRPLLMPMMAPSPLLGVQIPMIPGYPHYCGMPSPTFGYDLTGDVSVTSSGGPMHTPSLSNTPYNHNVTSMMATTPMHAYLAVVPFEAVTQVQPQCYED